MLKLNIVGAFWQGIVVRKLCFDFMGEIELNPETGEFTGTMSDHFGNSKITGKTDKQTLTYVKTYEPGEKGDDKPIQYSYSALGGVTMPDYTGAWLGKYQLAIREDMRGDALFELLSTDKAYCILIPPGDLF